MAISSTKCILISNKIPGLSQLISSIKVSYLEVSEFNNIENIDTFFNTNSLNNLTHFAFMYDNNNLFMNLFPMETYFGELFSYFIGKLVLLNSSIIIDIITCNINKEHQKNRITELENIHNINIRYSLNATGDYNIGGDWILESDHVNIKDTYFNDNINSWNYILYSPTGTSLTESLLFDISGNHIVLLTDVSNNPSPQLYDSSGINIKYPPGKVVISGGTISADILTQLSSNIIAVISNRDSFAALTIFGGVITWGAANPASVSAQLSKNVNAIYRTGNAFAAVKLDGSVITWGNTSNGGDSSTVSSQLQSGVRIIFSNLSSFAALKYDGSVVTWGSNTAGGNSSSVSSQLQSNVITIYSNNNAFAALKVGGSVVTWGNTSLGGNMGTVSSQLQSNVKIIYSTDRCFAALKLDGSVVTWGNTTTSAVSVSAQLRSNIKTIYSNWAAFHAVNTNGGIISWGDDVNGMPYGQNLSSVSSSVQSNVRNIYDCTDINGFIIIKDDLSILITANSQLANSSVVSSVQNKCTFSSRFYVKTLDNRFIHLYNGATYYNVGRIYDGPSQGYVLNQTSTSGCIVATGIASNFVKARNVYSAVNLTYFAILDRIIAPPTGNVVASGQSKQGEILSVINTIVDTDGVSGNFKYQWTIANTISGTYNNITDTTDASNNTFITLSSHIGKYIKVIVSYTDLEGTLKTISGNYIGPIIATPNNILPTGQNSYTVTVNGTPQTITKQTSVAAAPDNAITVIESNSLVLNTMASTNRTYTPGAPIVIAKTTFNSADTTAFISTVKSANTSNVFNILITRTIDSVPTTTNAVYAVKADGPIRINDASKNIVTVDLSGSGVTGVSSTDLILSSLSPSLASDASNNICNRFFFKLIDLSANSVKTSGFSIPMTFDLPNLTNITRVLLKRFNDSTSLWDTVGIANKDTTTNLFTYVFTSNSDYTMSPLAGGAAGDPHIYTFNGEKYDLPNVYGKFLLFDNNKTVDNLKITCICKQLTPDEIKFAKFTNNYIKTATFMSRIWINYNDEEVDIDMKTLDVKQSTSTNIIVNDIYTDTYVFKHNYDWIKMHKYNIHFNGRSREIIVNNTYRIKVSLDLNCADHRNEITMNGPDLISGYGALVSKDHNSLLVKF